MKRLSLTKGNLTLEFMPELGGSISAFYANENGRRIDLMRPAPESGDFDVLSVSSFPLTPFSNRIGNGQLNFQGKTYAVGPLFRDEPHPNHGDGWTSAWTVESQEKDRAILSLTKAPQPGTPYAYRAEQEFRLGDGYLDITIGIENQSTETLPFGLGHHPYFVRTPDVRLQANLTHIWNSENMLPTDLVPVPANRDFSRGKSLTPADIGQAVNGFSGKDFIDNCFQGWDNKAVITWPSQQAQLTITSDPMFSHFVLYVPGGEENKFFCAEPVSHATDAFNLAERGVEGTGIRTLAPGKKMGASMRFAYGRLTTV